MKRGLSVLKTPSNGKCKAAGSECEWAAFAVNDKVECDKAGENGLCLWGDVDDAAIEKLAHEVVDDWAEWLHEVIGECEGILAILMKNPDSRMKTRCDDGPRHSRSKDCISVVQKRVRAASVCIAAKISAQEQRPVPACRLRFDVAYVAAFDLSRENAEPGAVNSVRGEHRSLHADFRLHDELPKAFLQRFAGVPLGAHARTLRVVSL